MILYLTDPDREYAADYLVHGLVSLLGASRVAEYPRKLSLHMASEAERLFDCDMDLGETAYLDGATVADCLSECAFKLIVIPTLRGAVRGQLMAWQRAGLLARNRDVIVAVDGEDDATNTCPLFAACIGGEPAAYFKRELPRGATWAASLPFGYPEERIQPVPDSAPLSVAYMVEVWNWARGGLRERLGQALQLVPKSYVQLFYEGEHVARLTLSEYHRAMRKALIAVSPSGRGSFANRHFEAMAYGCCPVLEFPTCQWPQAPQPAEQAYYFSDVDDAVRIVRLLVEQPDEARRVARNAQQWLRQYGTTRVRAQAVWESVHGSASNRAEAACG